MPGNKIQNMLDKPNPDYDPNSAASQKRRALMQEDPVKDIRAHIDSLRGRGGKSKPISDDQPAHYSNPIEYYGSGSVDSIADGGGPLQIIENSEMWDQFGDGPDEFMCDFGDRPGYTHPGVKVKKFPRRQAY
jgi:hypothetical protein